MEHEESVQKLRDYAFKLIALRPRSISEIRNLLSRYANKHHLMQESKVSLPFTKGEDRRGSQETPTPPDTSSSLRSLGVEDLFAKEGEISLIDMVIDDLIARNYLDDTAFIQWWIEQRDNFKPKGNRLLEQELRQKGVSVDLIRSVLAQQQPNRSGEKEVALQLASDRLRKLSSYPTDKQKEKLTRFLLSRGYHWEIADAVIDSLFQKTYNTNTQK